VKIKLDVLTDYECSIAIRDKIVCGGCSSSTLLVWKAPSFGDPPKGSSHLTVVVKDQTDEVPLCYLVRCSFFKFNVNQPDDVVYCEGFKQIPYSE